MDFPRNSRTPPSEFRPPKKTTHTLLINKGKHVATGCSNAPLTTSTIVNNAANELNDQQVKRAKATWTDETTRIFCEVCAEEVNAGNRPNTHFNKIGWSNVVKKFQLRTGKKYDQKQLKNKWEKVKSEYTTWKNLIEKETGLGWDHEKNTIDAPDEWWAAQEKANANIAKFREGGIENLTELEIMFNKICASSTTSWNPYSQELTEIEDESTTLDEDVEQVDITLDDSTTHTPPTRMENEDTIKPKDSGKQSLKVKKSKVSTAKLMQSELKRIVGAMESFSQSSGTVTSRRSDQPGCSIQECLALLSTTPGVEVGSELYMLGTRLFVKREYREMFVAIPNEAIRYSWLEQELDREKK